MEKRFSLLSKQIGISTSIKNTDELAKVLCYFADTFAFENIDVLQKNIKSITPQFLSDKLLEQQRGGLCYEINALLYLFLQELGYDVTLVQGTVFTENGWATDGTHVLIVVNLNGKRYVVDNGFGSNIARKPLEIDGKPVEAPAGIFRVVQRVSEKGTLTYEKKEADEWNLKYAFHPERIAWKELDRIKRVITESDSSTFNRQMIISQCLNNETYSINESRLRIKRAGNEETDTSFQTDEDLLCIINARTNPSIYTQAKKYLAQVDKK